MLESQIFPANEQIQTLGWVLLNFVWQGLLLAAVLKGLLSGMRRCSAALRYSAATAVLFTMLAVPVASFLKPHLLQPGTQSAQKETAVMSYSVRISPGDLQGTGIVSNTGLTDPAINWKELLVSVQHVLPWICVLWLTGVLPAFTRAVVGLIKVRQLQIGAVEFQGRIDLPTLTRKLGIRSQVRLLVTKRVAVPSVIGWLKPVILLPEGNRFPPEQVEALVAHELAHIRRQDYLVNLFQVLVEALLFYHPAVWWVSSQVRVERESCCDDAAIPVCRSIKTYVRSLTEAERYRSVSKWAVAASGASLLNRIRRITDMKKRSSNRFVSWSVMALGVSSILVIASGSSLLAFIPEPFHTPADSAVRMTRNTNPSSFTVAGTFPEEASPTVALMPHSAATEQTEPEQLNPQSPQVMIDFLIVEIAASELDKLEFPGKNRMLSPANLADLMDKIQSGEIKAKIVSNPKVLALDRKECKIAMSEKIHYMVRTGDGLYKTKAFETPVGIQLSIVPTLVEEAIKMNIHLEATDISGRLTVSEVPDLNIGKPTIRTREHTTDIVLKDGETVVVGGMKNSGSEEENEMAAFITASIVNR